MSIKRLPKKEYFELRYKQAVEGGRTSKAAYYRGRLDQMNEPKSEPEPEPEPQTEYKWVFSWLSGGWNWTEGRDWKHGMEEFRKRGFDDHSIADINLSTVRKVTQSQFDDIWSASYMD